DLEGANMEERRTCATIAALVTALWILAVLARPFRLWKGALVATMAAVAVAAIAIPPVRDLFELDVHYQLLPVALAVGAAGALGVELLSKWVERHPTGPAEPVTPR